MNLRVFVYLLVVTAGSLSSLWPTHAGAETPADRGGPTQTREVFRWSGDATGLALHNLSGPIEITGGSGARVEIVAVARSRRSDPARVRVELVQDRGRITVCALWPARVARCEAKGMTLHDLEKNDVSVTFQVRVPDGIPVLAENVNGSITSRGTRGGLELTTVNGALTIEAGEGAVRAESVSGAIDATLGNGVGDVELTTVNGGVTVSVPEGFSASVEASVVNGRVRMGNRNRGEGGSFVLGRGGRRMALSTVNGGIEIR